MPSLADGRCFTNYMASCHYDQQLQTKFKRFSEPEYRTFLQSNAMAAQDETRKLHVCAFAFDSVSTGPSLAPATYVPSVASARVTF